MTPARRHALATRPPPREPAQIAQAADSREGELRDHGPGCAGEAAAAVVELLVKESRTRPGEVWTLTQEHLGQGPGLRAHAH